MHLTRAGLILGLSVFAMFGTSCAKPGTVENANFNTGSAASNSNSAKTNAEELGLLLNIPFEPEDVAWKQADDGKKLKAVLLLKQEDADALIRDAAAITPPRLADVSSETWFPAELIAQSGLSSEDTLKGVSYAPNTFLQPPYTSGRVTRIENTDYFVLEVEAK